jgi:hypothetical protein
MIPAGFTALELNVPMIALETLLVKADPEILLPDAGHNAFPKSVLSISS